STGLQQCVGGVYQGCSGNVGPRTESCNNRDDDCDSVIDNGITRRCGTDTGECVAGIETCSAGAFMGCTAVAGTTESCNTLDDDCATATCTVSITAVPNQDLHVELVWNTAWGDADLQMTQAGVNPATAWYMNDRVGELACWWDNRTAAWPPNGGQGDATLDID